MVLIDLSRDNYRGNKRFLKNLGLNLNPRQRFLDAVVESNDGIYINLLITLKPDYVNYKVRIKISKGGSYETLEYSRTN
jgi:hypothetical protein